MENGENTTSDERIGEAAITLVMQNQLSKVRSWEAPPLTPLVQEEPNQQEKKITTQIAEIICMIGQEMTNDQELNKAMDEVTSCDCAMMPERFWRVLSEMFSDGEFNWGRIAVVIYMAGKIAVRLIEGKLVEMVEDRVSPVVLGLLKQMVSFFKAKLLCWINCFSALARQVNRLSSTNTQPSRLVLVLAVGLPLVSIITWRVARGTGTHTT